MCLRVNGALKRISAWESQFFPDELMSFCGFDILNCNTLILWGARKIGGSDRRKSSQHYVYIQHFHWSTFNCTSLNFKFITQSQNHKNRNFLRRERKMYRKCCVRATTRYESKKRFSSGTGGKSCNALDCLSIATKGRMKIWRGARLKVLLFFLCLFKFWKLNVFFKLITVSF